LRFFSFFSFLPFLDDRLRLLLRLLLRRRLSFLLFFVDFFLRSRDDDDRDDDDRDDRDRDDRDREDDDPDRLLEPDPDDGLLPRPPAPFSPSSFPLPLPGGLRLTLRRQIHGIGRFRRSSARASRKDPGPGAWGADPYDGPAAFG
jgi:hypothetical protein